MTTQTTNTINFSAEAPGTGLTYIGALDWMNCSSIVARHYFGGKTQRQALEVCNMMHPRRDNRRIAKAMHYFFS